MPFIVYAISIGAAAVTLTGFCPIFRNLISWRSIRKSGIRPGDVVEYEYDIAWVRKTGPVYTALDARDGYRVFIPNHLFLEPTSGRGRYARRQVVQRLPASAILLIDENIGESMSSECESIGTVELDAGHHPVLRTEVWMRRRRDREDQVRRAILEEAFRRATDMSETPYPSEHMRTPTVH
jgi:hypothetical protein